MKKGGPEEPPIRLCPKIPQWNYFKKLGTAGGDFCTNLLPILHANYYLAAKVAKKIKPQKAYGNETGIEDLLLVRAFFTLWSEKK